MRIAKAFTPSNFATSKNFQRRFKQSLKRPWILICKCGPTRAVSISHYGSLRAHSKKCVPEQNAF